MTRIPRRICDWLYSPRVDRSTQVRCPAATRALLRGVNPSSQPLILVLDEVPGRLRVLSAYFDDAGCAVIEADDIEQALTISSVIRPDLMVLPEQRPGMSGRGGQIAVRAPDLPDRGHRSAG